MKGSKLKIAVILLLIIFFGLLILFGGFFSRPMLEGALNKTASSNFNSMKIDLISGTGIPSGSQTITKSFDPNKYSFSNNITTNLKGNYYIQVYYGIPAKADIQSPTFINSFLPIVYLNHNLPTNYKVFFSNSPPYGKGNTNIYISYEKSPPTSNTSASWFYKEVAVYNGGKSSFSEFSGTNKKEKKQYWDGIITSQAYNTVAKNTMTLSDYVISSEPTNPSTITPTLPKSISNPISSMTYTLLSSFTNITSTNTFSFDAKYGSYGTGHLSASSSETNETIPNALNLMTFYCNF
jgi:hypothetical protein